MPRLRSNPTDVHVGNRVRMRRKMLSMSQTKLGDALELSFQQVQKYESGTNRIGASRLQQIARVLQVTVSFFFEDPLRPGVDASAEQIRHDISKLLTSTDGLALSKAFTRVADANVRRAIVQLVEEIAAEEG